MEPLDLSAFADLVKRARSCRRFVTADPVPPELVRQWVDLIRLVPSAANQQPLRYRLVTSPQECAQVFPHTKWAGALKDWAGPTEAERPTAYVIIVAERGKTVGCDVGIAAQTLQLAATASGYAACMLGAINRAALQSLFALDEKLEIQLVVALGRPGESIVLEEVETGGTTAYWRSADGVHHVPKRQLKDVVIK